jgi:hypothetical protein
VPGEIHLVSRSAKGFSLRLEPLEVAPEDLRVRVDPSGPLKQALRIEVESILLAPGRPRVVELGATLAGAFLAAISEISGFYPTGAPGLLKGPGVILAEEIGHMEIERGGFTALGGKQPFGDGNPSELLPEEACRNHGAPRFRRAGMKPEEVSVFA